ncbi:MAG: sigma 54-interacting transcriptional regulator, partial [Planctomycetota bacterium]
DLEHGFERVMQLLSRELEVQRAALVLWDRGGEQMRTVASLGLTPAERQRGRYAPGEGVTGRVMQTGEPAVIEDITKDPSFLNRTQARRLDAEGGVVTASGRTERLGFVCVPVMDGESVVGVISADLQFSSVERLHGDARLLRILAGAISQAVRVHELIQVEKGRWQEEKARLTDDLRGKYQFDNIIGTSPAMLDVLSTIAQVAPSRATVLLQGETGCGKELIAKAIHYNSPRKDDALVRVNCGALSPQLLESELFGHVAGAFTGAVRDKIGRFEAAEAGTIFLDEVGTLDPPLQVKLLRVLQEREFERVGDHVTRRVDVRVIAGTNLDLEEESRKGTFREDLYYRLNVVTVHIPPLRTRRSDIPELIDHFLDRYNRENGKTLSKMSGDVLNTLMRYPWPGNVRELENCIERAVVLSTADELSEGLLPLQVRMYAQQTRGEGLGRSLDALYAQVGERAVEEFGDAEGEVYDRVIHGVERKLLQEALRLHRGVKTKTADFLGINRNTLNKKVRELGIEGGEG